MYCEREARPAVARAANIWGRVGERGLPQEDVEDDTVYACMNRRQSEQDGLLHPDRTRRSLLLIYTLAVQCGSDSPLLLWEACPHRIDQLRRRRLTAPGPPALLALE